MRDLRTTEHTTTMTLRTLLACSTLAWGAFLANAQDAPKTIYSYAIGNWRKDYTAFKDITDIDVQRFATMEEGNESRTTLRAKYLTRKLEVLMVEPPAK
jgi:hypothetical protein